MAGNPLKPRKLPRQTRSTAMVELILEAATRVLSKESLDGFTTNRVADVAGISVGSLYQYFPNKNALVAALIEREHVRLADAIEASLQQVEGLSLRSGVARLIEIGIAYQFGNPLYAAALDHEERRLPVDAVVAGSRARMVLALQQMLAIHFPAWRRSTLQQAAADCLTISKALIDGASGTAVATGQGSSRKLSVPPDLRRRISRAVLGYLTIPAGPAVRRRSNRLQNPAEPV